MMGGHRDDERRGSIHRPGSGETPVDLEYAETPDLEGQTVGIRAIRSSRLAITCLVATTPFLGWFAWLAASRYEKERVESQFVELLTRQSTTIERTVGNLIEGLHAVQSLFLASETVTREEFATFSRGMLERHSEIGTVAWAPRAGSEDSFDGGDRYAALYLEPWEENGAQLGLDIASDPAHRKALMRAIVTHQASLTEPTDSIRPSLSGKGALVLLPVYEREGPSAALTVPEGIVLLELDYREVVEKALRLEPSDHHGWMRLQLVDRDAGGTESILLSSAKGEELPDVKEWTASSEIPVGGRTWVLRASPTPEFLAEHRTVQPVLLGLSTALITGLLFGALLGLAWRSRHLALRVRDRMVHRVLGSLQEGVIVSDGQGRVRFINGLIKRILGPQIAESPSDWATAAGCFRKDGRTPYPHEELPLARAIRGERVPVEEIFVRNSNVPEGMWLSVTGAPLLDETMRRQGGVVVVRDITENREKSAHLERLSSALDQTTDMVVITDHEGTIIYVNPAFFDQTGYTAEEALGKTPRVLRSGAHEAAFYRRMWETLLDGKVYRSIITNRKKNGEEYQVDQVISPITDEEGKPTHFVSVSRDITDRLKWEERSLEMRMASLVQERLYPQEALRVPGLDIAGVTLPAVETCGDYYDFIPAQDGKVYIAIGDICGHGFGSSLLMAETRAYLRGLVQIGGPLEKIVERLNTLLEADLADNYFVTLLLVVIDLASGSLSYVNAGHTPGYILRPDGTIELEMVCSGTALGIVPDSKYDPPEPTRFDPGETLLLLTDGIVEARARDRSFFGSERALAVLRRHHRERAERIVERLGQVVEEFTGSQLRSDDQTIVVGRRTTSAPVEQERRTSSGRLTRDGVA